MADEWSNDNDAMRADAQGAGHDPSGQAALLLVESLIHGLIERSIITTADAIAIVSVAAEVKNEIGEDLGDSPATLAKSLTLLESIRVSLSND